MNTTPASLLDYDAAGFEPSLKVLGENVQHLLPAVCDVACREVFSENPLIS